MAKISLKELRQVVISLKNYVDSAISNIPSTGGNDVDLTNYATKKYSDQKISYKGLSIIYSVPEDQVTQQRLQNAGYAPNNIVVDYYFEIDENSEYIITYKSTDTVGVYNSTFNNANIPNISTNTTANKITIIPGYITDDNGEIVIDSTKTKSIIRIENMNLASKTSIDIKKNINNTAKIIVMSKNEYDLLENKDNSTIYMITE